MAPIDPSTVLAFGSDQFAAREMSSVSAPPVQDALDGTSPFGTINVPDFSCGSRASGAT